MGCRRGGNGLRQSRQCLDGKTALLIDDDARGAFALPQALDQFGMKTTPTSNGRDGIEMLRTQGFDIVLIDVIMPGLDGYDTLTMIRKIKKFRSIPMIALTAKAMPGDREKCLRAGATD